MAITGTAELTYENAWVHALGKSADLAALCAIRNWEDQSADQVYPVTLVHCSGVDDATSGEPDGYDEAYIEISCRTWKDNDLAKSVVSQMIGAVRDVLNSATLKADLEDVGGVDVATNLVPHPSWSDDEGDVRIRSITVITIGTLVHLPA